MDLDDMHHTIQKISDEILKSLLDNIQDKERGTIEIISIINTSIVLSWFRILLGFSDDDVKAKILNNVDSETFSKWVEELSVNFMGKLSESVIKDVQLH